MTRDDGPLISAPTRGLSESGTDEGMDMLDSACASWLGRISRLRVMMQDLFDVER